MNMDQWDIIATATFGLEAVVARELRALGYNDLKVENSRVIFKGSAIDVCRTNLWLRSADRVFIRIGEFSALSFEELFERTKALPWEEWLPEDAEFPVLGKSVKSKQQKKKTDIYEALIAEGYDISYPTVVNTVNNLLSKGAEAYIKAEYDPGDVCEFDWGEVKTMRGIGCGPDLARIAAY
jgi:hypothetical protein